MANDPRFEVFPEHQIVRGGEAEHPRKGIVQTPARVEPTGEFAWRFRAGDGKISATGGEGFTRRADAHRAVNDFCAAMEGLIFESQDGSPPTIAPVISIIDVDE